MHHRRLECASRRGASTLNLAEADPDCDLDYVPGVPPQADVRIALSNSIGLGGHNSALIVRRYEACR
jgi:3-oxoacyl-[acyl-carrier-protein] synthase II